jgi:hypothetical protein
VLLVDGRVAIVQHGAPAKVVGGGHGTARGAALAGRWLVVLAANRLWVYDARSGGFHASYPAVGATRVDLYAGIAVLTTRLKLVAVRVTNGHRRVVSTLGRGRAFVRGAEVEAGGVVWATQPARVPLNGLNVVYRLPLPAIR